MNRKGQKEMERLEVGFKYVFKESTHRNLNASLCIVINSPGRWVILGIAIYDKMQFAQPYVI